MNFDMHMHSTCSDGEHAPLHLVELCKEMNIRMMSITDHDNMDAYDQILQMVEKQTFPDNLIYIPGVELYSVSAVDSSSQHLGVYFPFLAIASSWPQKIEFAHRVIVIDKPICTEYQYEQFQLICKTLEELKLNRVKRNLEVIRNLNSYHSLNLDEDEFCAMFEINKETFKCQNTIGRPQVARYLISRGVVQTVKEAFGKLLSNDSPAIPAMKFKTLEEMTQHYKMFNAKCIICHPNQNIHDISQLKRVIYSGIQAGILGIEKYHTETDHTELNWFKGVKSIGSDYHGYFKPDVPLGNLKDNAIMTDHEKKELVSNLFEVVCLNSSKFKQLQLSQQRMNKYERVQDQDSELEEKNIQSYCYSKDDIESDTEVTIWDV